MDTNDPALPMHGEAVGRSFVSGEPTRIIWENGIIRSMEKTGDVPTKRWLAPALFDPQINGFGGMDFQQATPTIEELTRATLALQAAGCGAYLLTLVTDHWERLMDKLEKLVKLRATSGFLQKAIAGWHIEGPFLSPQPGFCGAHDPAKMCNPTPEKILELRRVTQNDRILLTLAPERDGALPAIAQAVQLGMQVSIGHTNASLERLMEAVKAGARAFTHLGNGCPQLLDRHDNILWRLFEMAQGHGAPYLLPSLIPDGIHVSPTLFRLMHRQFGTGNVFYTTDAMSAAGMPPGKYRLGPLEVEVGADQVVRMPGHSNYAGSALTPLQGVQRAANMLDSSWIEAWDNSSTIPARLMNLDVGIRVGGPARFCIVEGDATNALQLRQFIG